MELVPSRLRGETAAFDIKAGKLVVEQGRRITARHIRELEKAKAPRNWMCPMITCWVIPGKDIVNKKPVKLLLECNTEITRRSCWKSWPRTRKDVTVLRLVHQRPGCGPIRLRYPAYRPVSAPKLEALVEIYRMMRPGEPPTKEPAEGLFQNLFFSSERYDLSGVGRMKFNRRLGSRRRKAVAYWIDEDIVVARAANPDRYPQR